MLPSAQRNLNGEPRAAKPCRILYREPGKQRIRAKIDEEVTNVRERVDRVVMWMQLQSHSYTCKV